MKILFITFLFIYFEIVAGNEILDREETRKKIYEILSKARTILFSGYHLVTRQVAVEVFLFRNYGSATIVYYHMTVDVSQAVFTFKSEEIHRNKIGSCIAREVIIHLKHGSCAAVNPDEYEFPKNFIDPEKREPIYTILLMSDGETVSYSINNPKPGPWYAIAYVKWQDPRTYKIEQQGLVATCQTILYSDLQVKTEKDVESIDCISSVTIDYKELPMIFKCMSLDSLQPVLFEITVLNIEESTEEILFRIGPISIPTDQNNLVNCIFKPKQSPQLINYIPYPTTWHYIEIKKANITGIPDCALYTDNFLSANKEGINHTIIDLMRHDKSRFFSYNYALLTRNTRRTSSFINMTSSIIKSLRFNLLEVLDVGGCLVIDAIILTTHLAACQTESIKESSFFKINQVLKIVICIGMDHPNIPLQSGHCEFNEKKTPALFVLSNVDSKSTIDKSIIPFPDSGLWYISIRLFCYEMDCSENHENGTDLKSGYSNCYAGVDISVSSSYCINGKCGKHGSCEMNMHSGHTISYCACENGYGGWDCSDSSRRDPDLLLGILLLTLSNLFFLFTIYIAIIRHYFTIAAIYTSTMIFSTFYHACDAPKSVAFCIMPLRLHQFSDFYSGIVSFWVTLLFISILNEECRSIFLMLGAIFIAILLVRNMHSIISFATPTLTALIILVISWVSDYFKSYRKWKFPRNYYMIYLPVSCVSMIIGLICYAFLQNEKNYKITHSLWHIVIAFSAAFALPDVRRENPKNAFLPNKDFGKEFLRKLFKRPNGQ